MRDPKLSTKKIISAYFMCAWTQNVRRYNMQTYQAYMTCWYFLLYVFPTPHFIRCIWVQNY